VPRRLTNDLLLALVLGLVLSGIFGWALPVAVAAPLYDLHRAFGVAVLAVLLVWKQDVIRKSLGRRLRRRTFDRSLVWGVTGAIGLALGVCIGVAWSLNLISFDLLWGYSPLNIHVFVGIGLLPFVGWHVWVRRVSNKASAPVATRRAAIRVLGLGLASLVGVFALPWFTSTRRDTGSKFAAALSGNAYPAEIWLFDTVPSIDPTSWLLQIGDRSFGLADLGELPQREVQAVLDCTGGWWTEQLWRGAPLAALLPEGTARVTVVSTTGHTIGFNAADLSDAVLATHVGGEPLSPAHGFPVRLAVPGRRGYQWVKWVQRIDVS
jgi:hypothetical protein